MQAGKQNLESCASETGLQSSLPQLTQRGTMGNA